MGLFSPYRNSEPTPAQNPATPPASAGSRPAGKDRATPTRREAEQARRQRLNPQLTKKEARLKARAGREAETRKRASAFDNVPARVLMRDHVDSRFNLAEWSMPTLMILLALSLVVSPMVPMLVEPTLYATWAFMALVVVDIFVMWRQFKKLAAERIPNEPLKGMLYYGFNRALSLRRFRLPLPRIKRGESF